MRQPLTDWIGRQEATDDRITAAPLTGWRATLDKPDGPAQDGEVLPPLGHWLYFLPRARASDIGPDGHPRRGGFLPPVGLPRRMWAGGRVRFHQPLRVGEAVRRVSTIKDVREKHGRSGALVFVVVEHRIHGPGGLAVVEEHDIVYRDPPAADTPPPLPRPCDKPAVWHEPMRADPVLLFRYSALTFNGHRIHYDRTYAVEEEGYPGLVVHGPLIATLLADLAARHAGGRPLTRFDYRVERPIFDVDPFSLNGAPVGARAAEVWSLDHGGAVSMVAEAEW